MPGFEEGLAGSIAGTAARSQQGMLELQMLSKRMEMEAANRKAEMEQAHQYNLVSGEQATGILKAAGIPEERLQGLAQLFPNGVDEKTLSTAANAWGMSQRIPAFQSVNAGMDSQGNLLTRIFNKKSGQWETQAIPTGGLSGTASEDVAKVRQGAQEMRGIVGLVDQQVKNLYVAAGATGLPEQAATNKINQYLQNDSGAMKAYSDTLASHNQRFEYMLSHNPRIPQEIVAQAKGQWFNPMTDIGATWEKKKQNLNSLISNSERAGLAAHGLQPLADTEMHFNEGFNQGAQSASQAAKNQYLQSLNQQFGQQTNGKSQ